MPISAITGPDMSENRTVTGPLSVLEETWNTPRGSWTHEKWRKVAELLERNVLMLQEELKQIKAEPKRAPGRPRKKIYSNYITDSYFASIGGRPVKQRGRPPKYDNNFWKGFYEHVELIRAEIKPKSGKPPTIKMAIEELVGRWGLANRRPKYIQQRQVARLQRLYSTAKKKSQK